MNLLFKLIRILTFDYRPWRKKNTLTVFLFHSINDSTQTFYPSISIETFVRTCEFIKKNYKVIHFQEVENNFSNQTQPAAVISFDDGMKDIVTVVLPIMKKLGLKFNINIDTEILETNKPQRFIQVYDILNYGRKKDSYFYALFMNSPITINYSAPHLTEAEFTKLLSNLSVEQKDSLIQNMIETFEFNTSNFTKVISIHDLIDLGKEKLVEIGSHSHTHPDFSTLHEQELIYEMKHSKNTLEKLIQKKVDIIAYPNGITSESIDLHAKRCGYRILLKTNDQINTINNNTTSFYRIHEYHNNVELLLAHSYGILNKLKKVLR